MDELFSQVDEKRKVSIKMYYLHIHWLHSSSQQEFLDSKTKQAANKQAAPYGCAFAHTPHLLSNKIESQEAFKRIPCFYGGFFLFSASISHIFIPSGSRIVVFVKSVTF